jgi:Skp family chaperone for outer membrane proteins
MKKVFLAMLALCVFLITNQKLNAQAPAIKVGIFDIDVMVSQLPEYRTVDSLTAQYAQDTLAAEYQEYQNEYQRLDSTYKADSAAKRPQSVLDYSKNLRTQMAYNLIYWQQIEQQKENEYRGRLAQPLYQKVVAAYKKVLAANKYNLILKLNSFEIGTHADNLFPLVAKEMNVTLPEGLMGDPNQMLDQATGTNPQQKTGTGKP